ncbi:proline/serine-rich coiled-coil protein 1 [Amia ocellicauda]|uniref:proline/serine-rich coiled-coil protein 1 n=1 Tax=Amia ocellicauda TaxID=2972642 RepID=UPI003464192C
MELLAGEDVRFITEETFDFSLDSPSDSRELQDACEEEEVLVGPVRLAGRCVAKTLDLNVPEAELLQGARGAGAPSWSPLSAERLEQISLEANRLARQLRRGARKENGGGAEPRCPRRETYVVRDSPVKDLLPSISPAPMAEGPSCPAAPPSGQSPPRSGATGKATGKATGRAQPPPSRPAPSKAAKPPLPQPRAAMVTDTAGPRSRAPPARRPGALSPSFTRAPLIPPRSPPTPATTPPTAPGSSDTEGKQARPNPLNSPRPQLEDGKKPPRKTSAAADAPQGALESSAMRKPAPSSAPHPYQSELCRNPGAAKRCAPPGPDRRPQARRTAIPALRPTPPSGIPKHGGRAATLGPLPPPMAAQTGESPGAGGGAPSAAACRRLPGPGPGLMPHLCFSCPPPGLPAAYLHRTEPPGAPKGPAQSGGATVSTGSGADDAPVKTPTPQAHLHRLGTDGRTQLVFLLLAVWMRRSLAKTVPPRQQAVFIAGHHPPSQAVAMCE